MMQNELTKSLPVSKHKVWESYLNVRKKQGGAGVDRESIEQFDASRNSNLYKIWNLMRSGSYFPPAVSTVFIPKKQGGLIPLVNLSDVIRDFKKFTAKEIISCIENNERESRRGRLLWLLKKDGYLWFWEEGYHAKKILMKEFFLNEMDYIHFNPLRAGFVEMEEEYIWSSCADIYGVRKGALELVGFL